MDNVGVIIPAAGQGTRMGAGVSKQFLTLTGIPILAHTIKVFQEAESVREIVVVGAQKDIPLIEQIVRQFCFNKVTATTIGGEQRQESVFAGLKALNPAIQTVVVHDGARPLLTLGELNRFLAEAEGSSGAIMAVEVKDTIKEVDAGGRVLRTHPRGRLRAVQTPQLFPRRMLQEAHARAEAANFVATDDAALLEWLNQPIQVLPGSLENIKITTPEDLLLAEKILEKRREESSTTDGRHHFENTEQELVSQGGASETRNNTYTRTTNIEPRTTSLRIGIGYDVHKLVEGRPLILGGVEIPYDRGLLGHSDADVLLHAIMDALLGALALGDIGAHFPDTEEGYRGISSLILLKEVASLVRAKGYRVGNLDSILVAERPKLAPYISAMQESIARTLEVENGCVSVKATTTERLGFEGREEGISAQAVVNLQRFGED